jgi:hypothetical protein
MSYVEKLQVMSRNPETFFITANFTRITKSTLHQFGVTSLCLLRSLSGGDIEKVVYRYAHSLFKLIWTFCDPNTRALRSQIRSGHIDAENERQISKILNTYILLTLDPRRGIRGVSDIPPRGPCVTKLT